MPFAKGNPGGPGRPPGRSPSQMVRFDLKQAARQHCEEALQVVIEALHAKDVKVRLMAAEILFERGYGKSEQKADVDIVHKFAVVPAVMSTADWLRSRGDPQELARLKEADARLLELEAAPDDDGKSKLN
jgi:hypothetical protein